jgi:hypothetical protein
VRAALLLALLALAAAASAEGPPVAPGVEPRAGELLRKMSDSLRSAPAFTLHAEIVYDEALPSGRKLQFAAALDATMRRPDRLAIDYRSDLGGKQLWYDGKTLTLLDLLADVFARTAAAPTTSATLAKLEQEQGVSFPLADLVADDPYARLSAGALSGFLVGPGDVNGTTCHHLAFVQSNLDWQIWIDAGERPLPRKLVIVYTSLPSAPEYAAVLEWSFPKSISDERFAAQLPEQAHEVAFVAAPGVKETKP